MLKNLLKLFFPEICLGCSKLLNDNQNLICIDCRDKIPLTNHLHNTHNEAINKFAGKVPIEHASSMLYYHKKGIVQSLIHNLKYHHQQELGTLLGNWYAEDLKKVDTIKDIDFIIPVPLHKKRLRKRGYNQIDTFCKALSNSLKIPYEKDLLVRNKYQITQSKKN